MTQSAFTYRLERWALRRGSWVFRYDPRGRVPTMVFAAEPVHWSVREFVRPGAPAVAAFDEP